MGWILDDIGTEHGTGHEGWAAHTTADGRLAASSDNRGAFVPDPAYPDDVDRQQHVPYVDVIGWTVTCTCGWTGTTWRRSDVTAPHDEQTGDAAGALVDPVDPDQAVLPDGRSVEDVAHAEWLTHVAPGAAEARIRAAAAAVRAAQADLDEAVAAARETTPVMSWEVIGRAAGLTRQSAHERWSRRDLPGQRQQRPSLEVVPDGPCVVCGGYPEDHELTNHVWTAPAE